MRPGVLVRLSIVCVTTLLATLLGQVGGHLFPYRIGEIYPQDLHVRVDFEILNTVELANRKNDAESDKPKKEAKPSAILPPPIFAEPDDSEDRLVDKYTRGMVLVPHGQPIRGRQLALLRREHDAYQQSLSQSDHARRATGMFLIFALIAGMVVLYVARFQTELHECLRSIIVVCVLVLGTLALGVLLSGRPWHAAIVPLTMTAMLLSLVYNPQFALLMSFSLALAMTVILGSPLSQLLQFSGGLSAAVLLLGNVRTRTQLIQVSFCAGAVYFFMTVATGLLSNQTWSLISADAIRSLLWGTLAGFLLTGLLPAVEKCFGILTDISLLEFADGSHPLLQELVRRAPGTYTHSITVATLAEGAAESIGANPLLTRVGAYFHDIGKMLKPDYFIENQTGENRHDTLEPALSTLVIIGHVKDGLALANQYRLPRPIQNFIGEHHGTTLVEYFYREAMRMQGGGGAELESSFRYPGPKPQTRETGILMLADAIESSSRALSIPTPNSLRKLVHDLLMKRLLDGQFEESGLTLTELHRIEESLCKSLTALFHARIKYPEPDAPRKAG